MKNVLGSALLFLSIVGFASTDALAAEEKGRDLRDDGQPQSLEELSRDLRSWLGRWWDYFGGTTSPEQKPVISWMLRNREKLGLSEDQVKKLEQLRDDFEKESIQNDAEIRVAEIDLTNLLQAPNADLGKVEEKIREIERLRANLRIARVRTIEKGKALLTAEQKKKMQDLQMDQPFSRFHSWSGR